MPETTYTLTRDGERDLRFTGELIAEVSSGEASGPRTTRWTELALYRVASSSGPYVLQVVGCSRRDGERDCFAAYMCEHESAVVDALKQDNGGELGWLAKRLLEAAGIEAVETLS